MTNSERDRAFAFELGYPSDVDWRSVFEDAGKTVGDYWRGYTLACSGVAKSLEEWATTHETTRMRVLVDYPDDPGIFIDVTSVKARYRNSPLYSELRRYPHGDRITIHGLERGYNQQHLMRAAKGAGLPLQAIQKIPSITGRDLELSGETGGSIAKTYGWLWFCAQYEGLPTPAQSDLADVYNVHRITLNKYIKQTLNEDWSDIKLKGKHLAASMTLDEIPLSIRSRYGISK